MKLNKCMVLRRLSKLGNMGLKEAYIIEKRTGMPNRFKVIGLKNVSYRRRTFKGI